MKKFLKNKSGFAGGLISKGLVRLILAALLILVIVGFCSKAMSSFRGGNDQYIKAFERFFNGVDEMRLDRMSAQLFLDKKSAIIGFSDVDEPFECYNCDGSNDDLPTMIIDRPFGECFDSSCICLCKDDLKFNKDDELEKDGKKIKVGKCKMTCKKLSFDIADRTDVDEYDSSKDIYWKNGFLFVRDMDNVNGLDKYKDEKITLFVEKVNDVIGICNDKILKYHADHGKESCLTDVHSNKGELKKRIVGVWEYTWPLDEEYRYLTLCYQDTSPPYSVSKPHRGIDIGDSGIGGKDVKAIKGGIIIDLYKSCVSGNEFCPPVADRPSAGRVGNFVIIKHDDSPEYSSLYGHLATVKNLNIGDSVAQGQIIGTVGTTGYSTGNHLHLEIYDKNGILVNPCTYLDCTSDGKTCLG